MWKRLIVTSVFMSLALAGTVYARDIQQYNELKNKVVSSELLPEDITSSVETIYGVERSTALGAAMSSISNEGSGVIGIYAETTMHKPVDWAYLTVYLERWYEELDSWQIEATYEQEFLPENEEDGELTSAKISTCVTGQPTGYYYRVRTLHELEFDDGWYEAKVTKTDGILITSAP